MQKRAKCVGRRSKCLRFQPSKSSSSSPLDAYCRTHKRERQKFKTNESFSFITCCSQQAFFFIFWSVVLFFSMLVCPPLPKKAINNNTKGQ